MQQLIAKPKNFGTVPTIDSVTNQVVVLNTEQNIDQLLQEGQQIDIPFLYQVYGNFSNTEELATYEKNEVKLEEPENITYDFTRDIKFLVHRYFLTLQEHINANHFTVPQLRAYLLVKSYIIHYLTNSHSFQMIGKTLTQTISKENQTAVQEFHNQQLAFNNNSLFETGKQDSHQRRLQIEQIKSKVAVDQTDLYLKIDLAANADQKDQNKRYVYYRTESLRITNQAIDETIAGTRDVYKTYPSHFFYRTLKNNELVEFKQDVYCSVNQINLANLQEQAKLSAQVMKDAALVASFLVKDHEEYATSNKHFSQNAESIKANFYYPYYQLIHKPQKGDENVLSLDYFQITRLYVEAKLGFNSQ